MYLVFALFFSRRRWKNFCILKSFVFFKEAAVVTVKRIMPTTFDRNEKKNKSALSLSLFLSSLERKTRRGNKVLRKMREISTTVEYGSCVLSLKFQRRRGKKTDEKRLTKKTDDEKTDEKD